MYREHPLIILRYSAKNIWLLIFPLLRGAYTFTFDVNSFYSWLEGAWFDIAILAVIILFGYLKWYFSGISITETVIIHQQGVFIRRQKTVPYDRMSSVTAERPFYIRPFRAIIISCDTSAGIFKATDMRIMVNQELCSKILEHVPVVDAEAGGKSTIKPAFLSVAMLSAFFSSSLSGAVYVAAFFFKGGDIARDLITVSFGKITEETSKLTGFIIRNIPAAAVGAGIFFLMTWLLSFLMNLMRYSRFSIKSDRNTIEINCGVLTRRMYRINAGHINFTDLKQDFLMKVTRTVTVSISCAGYGKTKNQLPVLLPIRKMESSDSRGLNEYRPKLTSIWQYIWQPVIASAFIIPAVLISFSLFPRLQSLGNFLILMAEIPIIWLLVIRITAVFTSGICVREDKLIVKYAKGYMFHTIIAEHSRLVKLSVTQTPFQHIFGKCSIAFCFNGESTEMHKVKAIKLSDAEKIAALLGYEAIAAELCQLYRKTDAVSS